MAGRKKLKQYTYTNVNSHPNININHRYTNMVGRRRDDKYRYPIPNSLPPATRRKSQGNQHIQEQENNVHPLNGIQLTFVVTQDMVAYCFDVLVNHLRRTELPRSKMPKFTNDP